MKRLGGADLAALIAGYEQGGTVKELGRQFGITRGTASALLGRHGVERRAAGMTSEDVVTARVLYAEGLVAGLDWRDGWSLTQHGAPGAPA